MIHMTRWKSILIILTSVAGLLFSLPNILSPNAVEKMPGWLQSTVNLGLELQGGSHLQLEVNLKEALKDQMLNALDDVRSTLRKEKIGYTGLSLVAGKTEISFVLRDPALSSQITAIIRRLSDDFEVACEPNGRCVVSLAEKAVENRKKEIIDKSIEVIRRRIDESGTKEPLIQRQGDNRIIVQLPGVDSPEKIKVLIGRTAKLNFHLVNHDVGPISVNAAGLPVTPVPADSKILSEVHRDGSTTYIVVRKIPSITGDTLVDARPGKDGNGLDGVSITFNALGTRKFAEVSANNLKRQFAIVLDDKVLSAPVFQSVIPDGKAIITGNFTLKEASELSLFLRTGALPAPLDVIEERTVGPSLGADSIQDGKTATLFAFVLVAIFMVLNYSLFGAFAVVALAVNMLLLFAALSLLQATLTLPGIAGIALTIGMAVDANVLIYERIKEELRHGLRPIAAVEAGYSRALTTILDSNLTTLLGAAVLFEFGTGPIRGFAITLALGIIMSLFSSISLTRLIIISWLRNRASTKTLPI